MDGKRYVNSIDDPRFGQCFLLYFLQPMLLASLVLGYKLATELHVLAMAIVEQPQQSSSNS